MQSQRKPAAPRKTRASVTLPRPEYTAAVRYRDGSRDIFHVRNADDMADARALVLAELDDVANLVIALRN
ncbi:MAG: hypothetical protein CVU18_01650 [Betaproteobacteria bacterium HGW-Betaproteobacteria-12]|nr:MAG: hypothetical protein CVU18_01650 [Betaproteobacteria bacterium HGW-Betaproteobacteria-12]